MVSDSSGTTQGSTSDAWSPLVENIVQQVVAAFRTRGVDLPALTVRDQLATEGGESWDIALPLHRLAKATGAPAADLAAALAKELAPAVGLQGVAASGAYLNWTVDPVWLAQGVLSAVLGSGERYGHVPAAGAPVCVEHTSANPTGPFHIGRVRNAIIGDTIARVSRAAGRPVTTQYYVDDLGRQTAMITWIWSKPPDQWPPPIRETVRPATEGEKADLRFGRPYPAVSAFLKENPEAAQEVAAVVRQVESGQAPPRHREIAEAILSGMLASLRRLGVTFDEFVWESSFLKDGSVTSVIDRLKKAPHALQEENGAWAIDATSYGLPSESGHVVFLRADGTSLYVTRDIAYHLEKFRRFARVLDILGQDHLLHARTLEALLAELGETRRPEFVLYQHITVPGVGRMSTRQGSAVYLDDLLAEAVERARREVQERREDLPAGEVGQIAEQVACGAVRYLILRVAPEKSVAFRWEEALSFEGRSGPFLQYAYARASSLLRKAERVTGPYPFGAALLQSPDERALVRTLARLPEVVQYVDRSHHVHTLAGYAHDIAEAFNRFYQGTPVLKAVEERESRVALVAATRQVLGNTLALLGVQPLERM